jgi:hypothetical protein
MAATIRAATPVDARALRAFTHAPAEFDADV